MSKVSLYSHSFTNCFGGLGAEEHGTLEKRHYAVLIKYDHCFGRDKHTEVGSFIKLVTLSGISLRTDQPLVQRKQSNV